MRSCGLVIVGAGAVGRVVLDTAQAAGIPVRGFTDSAMNPATLVNGSPILGSNDLLDDRRFLEEHTFVVAIADQRTRMDLSLRISDGGGELATVAHPSCIVSPHASIGKGSILVAGCIVNTDAAVGDFCFLNAGCSVDHDCRVADGVLIGPGAHLAGWVQCGRGAFVGTGAAVIPKIKIGSWSTIGAGAVVVRDVPDNTTVVGSPARAVRRER